MADFEAKNRTFALSLVAAYSSNLDYFHHVLNVLGSYTGDSTQTLHTMGTNLFQQNNLNIKMSDVSLCSTVNANIVSEITCGNQSDIKIDNSSKTDIKIDNSSKTDRPLRRSSRVVAVPLGGYTNDLPEDVLVQVKQLKPQLQTPETSDLMKRKNPSKFLNNNSITIKRRNLTTKQTNYLINAFKTISNMSDKLNVTKVITDRANQLFKTVSEGKKLRGHSFDAIAAACMYIACRKEGMPRTFKDIVAVSTVSSMKTVTKCHKLILKVHDTHVDLITTADYISRFCETLSLDRDIEGG